jgi:hypothetical protein
MAWARLTRGERLRNGTRRHAPHLPSISRITTACKAQPVLPNEPMRAWRLPSATERTERTGHSLLIRY